MNKGNMNGLTDSIRKLQEASRALEPSADERKAVRNKVIEYSEEFLKTIYDNRAFVVDSGPAGDPGHMALDNGPVSIDEALGELAEHVDGPGLNPASGGHLGYIPGGGMYWSSLGDYMAAVTNRYAGVFFAGPGAVRMENQVLRWISGLIGYPETSAGNITSGGSMANLLGIIVARESRNIDSRSIPTSAVYLTEQSHHSLIKSLRIAGLKEAVVRKVPLDERFRMDARALERLIISDKAAGLKPWLILASAGTTDVGAIDPLNEIADLSEKHGLWLHVDAAYGGFFMLCPDLRPALEGISRADSVVLDPHKGLFLPYGCGVLLAKNGRLLMDAFRHEAAYLQDTLTATEEWSPADLSPELTKHFRGLRIWLPLQLAGIAPFAACLEEKILLARFFYEEIRKIDGFETFNEPDLTVVAFRYLPADGSATDYNKTLLHAIHEDGRVFISSTMINGQYALRIAVLCFRTHLETVALLLEILKEKVALLNTRAAGVGH